MWMMNPTSEYAGTLGMEIWHPPGIGEARHSLPLWDLIWHVRRVVGPTCRSAVHNGTDNHHLHADGLLSRPSPWTPWSGQCPPHCECIRGERMYKKNLRPARRVKWKVSRSPGSMKEMNATRFGGWYLCGLHLLCDVHGAQRLRSLPVPCQGPLHGRYWWPVRGCREHI